MALIFHGVPKVNSSCLKLLPITNGCWLDARLLNQWEHYPTEGNDSNLLIVFYVQIMPDDFVMQLHRF